MADKKPNAGPPPAAAVSSPPPQAGCVTGPATAVSAEAASAGSETRRNFLSQAVALVVGGLVGIIPFASGVLYFLDPILRKKKGAGSSDGFLEVANLSELPADGSPLRFTLRSDIRDAWTLYRNKVLGSVYLRLMPTGQVIAFNDTCTHLGCKVDYQAAESRFFCPCHQSAFSLEGKRQNETPPRDLDDLQVEVRDNKVWVKYQNFKTATSEKKAVS